MAYSTIKFRDYDSDVKQISIPSAEVTNSANYAAAFTAHLALTDAISDVVLGNMAVNAYTPRAIEVSAAPSSPVAQTNVQWLVSYHDAVNLSKQTLSIPTADIATAALRLPNSSQHDPAHAAWIAFKAAFEAFAVSNDGNAVVIDSIEFKE